MVSTLIVCAKDNILHCMVTKVHTFSSSPSKPVNTITSINCDESLDNTVNHVYSSENEEDYYVVGGKRVCCVYD
jgi:hypothetical protein